MSYEERVDQAKQILDTLTKDGAMTAETAKRILGGGPPRIDPDRHFDGCPAREGKPVCNCGGYRAKPEDIEFTAKLCKLDVPPKREASATEVCAYYPAVAEYVRSLEERLTRKLT